MHEIGLREVARIRAEMEGIIREVGFQGSFADFPTYLAPIRSSTRRRLRSCSRRAAWITREIMATCRNISVVRHDALYGAPSAGSNRAQTTRADVTIPARWASPASIGQHVRA